MLKSKLKFIVIFLISFLLCSYSLVLAADETNTAEATQNDVMPISTDQPVDETVYEVTNGSKILKGDDITVDENVSGNIFVIANSVTINSQIEGDAFVISKKLTVTETGYITNNLFALSDDVLINGVSTNAYISGENVTIQNGFIYSDLIVNCKNLNIFGSIGRNVFSKFDNVSFLTDSLVGLVSGNFTYYSNDEIQIPSEYIQGTVERKSLPTATFQDYLILLGSLLVLTIAIWGLSKWLSPKFINNSSALLKVKKGTILLSGLITLIAVPLISVILLLLKITANIGIILLLIYFVLIFMAKPVFLITISQYISEKLKMNNTIASLGVLIITGIILWAICLIPYVGMIISIITIIIGIGILFSNLLINKSNMNLDDLILKLDEKKKNKKNLKAEKKNNESSKKTKEN